MAQQPLRRSFAEVLGKAEDTSPCRIRGSTFYKGAPEVAFSSEEVEKLAEPLRFSLVGKFSHGRPPLVAIRSALAKSGFQHEVQVGLLNQRHVLLRFLSEEDSLLCWMKKVWFIRDFPMRLLKWSPSFRFDAEPSQVPVWVAFEQLPVHLFNKASLFSIAATLGKPLKVDTATAAMSRPNVAKVCVELDLASQLPDRIRISSIPGVKAGGFWQRVTYENLPLYCDNCFTIGHAPSACKHQSGKAKPKGQKVLLTSTSASTTDKGKAPAIQPDPPAPRSFNDPGQCSHSSALPDAESSLPATLPPAPPPHCGVGILGPPPELAPGTVSPPATFPAPCRPIPIPASPPKDGELLLTGISRCQLSGVPDRWTDGSTGGFCSVASCSSFSPSLSPSFPFLARPISPAPLMWWPVTTNRGQLPRFQMNPSWSRGRKPRDGKRNGSSILTFRYRSPGAHPAPPPPPPSPLQ
ncbi:hypothetical protein HPP92_015442 [Vanilla planifolia]|uniref:DUF4283 domain-containing protein n=1 Tax=Vanilla planifolia TaxID=51239 RepID=A0A835QRE9_VANPL|nr:hypothetical protein HPP92_015442 [Vanilla planifolia]